MSTLKYNHGGTKYITMISNFINAYERIYNAQDKTGQLIMKIVSGILFIFILYCLGRLSRQINSMSNTELITKIGIVSLILALLFGALRGSLLSESVNIIAWCFNLLRWFIMWSVILIGVLMIGHYFGVKLVDVTDDVIKSIELLLPY